MEANAVMDVDLGFDLDGNSEPINASGVMSRMKTIDSVLADLAEREEDLQGFIAGTSKDMGLDWVAPEMDSNKRGGVFLMKTPDFGELELDNTAVKSMCNMMNVKQSFYRQFENSNSRLIRDFKDFVDHSGKGCIILTGTKRDGINRRVESVVPSNFDRTSDRQILGAMLTRLNNDYPNKVRGVQVLNDGQNGTLNYRVLFGDPFLHEDPRNPNKSVIPMLSFMSSEIGLEESKVALGLYRVICANGVTRLDWEGGVARWSRKNAPNGFLSKIGDIIGNVGHFAAAVQNSIEPLLNQPLAASAIEILASLNQSRLIGDRHFDIALREAEYSPVATDYDLLNVLTSSAKHLNPLSSRQTAESNALRIAMQPGGFSGVFSSGFSKDAAKSQIASFKA